MNILLEQEALGAQLSWAGKPSEVFSQQCHGLKFALTSFDFKLLGHGF